VSVPQAKPPICLLPTKSARLVETFEDLGCLRSFSSSSKPSQVTTPSAEGEPDVPQNKQPSETEQLLFTWPGKDQSLPSSVRFVPFGDIALHMEPNPYQPNYSHKRQKICGGDESLPFSPPVIAANLDHGNQGSRLSHPSAQKLHTKKAASVLYISDELKTWVPPPFEPAEPSAAPSSKTGERSSAGERPAVQKSLSSPMRSPGLSTEGLPIVASFGSRPSALPNLIPGPQPAVRKDLSSLLRSASPDAKDPQVAALSFSNGGGPSSREFQLAQENALLSLLRREYPSTQVSQAVIPSSSSSGDSSRYKPQLAKKAKLPSPEPRTQLEAEAVQLFTIPLVSPAYDEHDFMTTTQKTRILALLPFRATGEDFSVRHERKFCFWIVTDDPNLCISKTTLFDPQKESSYFDGFVSTSPQGVLFRCRLCVFHQEETFELLCRHSLSEHGEMAEAPAYAVVCVHAAPYYDCGHDGLITLKKPFTGIFGHRFYHALLRKLFFCCHCGLPFASKQHLGVHFLVCKVDEAEAMLYGPSLYSWYMHAIGRNYDKLSMEVYDDKGGWMRLTDEKDDPQIVDLPSHIPRLLCQRSKRPPNLTVVRKSKFGKRSWTKHYAKSVHYWTHQHEVIFEMDPLTPDLIMHVQCGSRDFPLVPSAATTEFLEEILSTTTEKNETLLVVKVTAELAGAIEQIVAEWPDHKPVVKSYMDGFTCNLALLAIFCLATMSFHHDVKVLRDELVMTSRDMGDEEYDRCLAATRASDQIQRIETPEKDVWYRFDSRALALAIVDHVDVPEAAHVRPFMEFILTMNRIQQIKYFRGSGPRRTESEGILDSRRRLAALGGLAADKYERLYFASLLIAHEALNSD
jgi:hypothetical protein